MDHIAHNSGIVRAGLAPTQIRPARPVAHVGALSAAERLEIFDAIQRAMEAHGPGASVTARSGPDGIWWEVTPARHALLSTGARRDPFIAHLQPLLRSAAQIDVLAAFVMRSGVALIEPALRQALQRGARIRVITGDYLDITQAHALRMLVDLSLECTGGDDASQGGYPGALALRVVEHARLGQHATTFHPKAWLLRGGGRGVAFVGSSNLSRAALLDGLEWNLGIDSASDPVGFMRVSDAYDALWLLGQPPSPDWIDAYQARQRARASSSPAAEIAPDEAPAAPTPRAAQLKALLALTATRAAGQTRALVVMATGMGKTWLAAFDVQNFIEETRAQAPRVLLVAHRVELLRQAARTFRALFPDWRFSWCVGDERDLSGQLVLASVQKLIRSDQALVFDYVIIDEVHHAQAPGYLRLLERINARFLLGLTATPDRADGQDVRALFDGNVPFVATLREGIEQGALAPLHYYGLKDTIDYAPLPWRGGRFEPAALAEAAQTTARMERLWRALEEHAGARTLLFCCAISHAEFVAGWLGERGWRVACVHSGAGSDDRERALERLESGELEAICVVDLFNEGVDAPAVDRVVMLRPTESPVIFLQQLGRGLRAAPGKPHLTVIDLVGNHYVFLERLRLLCDALGQGAPTLRRAMEGGAGASGELPEGCEITLELEVVELVRELWPSESDRALVHAYRQLAAARAARPVAAELFVRGYNPLALRRQGGWLRFVEDEGGLTQAESAALAQERAWLDALSGWRWRDARGVAALDAWLERAEGGAWEADAALGVGAEPADEAVRGALLGLMRELVDGVVARRSSELGGAQLVGRVAGEGLELEAAPQEATLVARLDGGEAWRLWFDGARCVRARRLSDGADLPALLTALGGAGAQVALSRSPEGWWLSAGAAEEEAGEGGSRELEARWLEAAREAADRLWARWGGQAVSVDGRRFTLTARTRTGSLKITPEGSGARTISLTDLGWVLCAAERAEARGERADWAEVNRLRYRPGTSKAATRFIDTGWALRLHALLGQA